MGQALTLTFALRVARIVPGSVKRKHCLLTRIPVLDALTFMVGTFVHNVETMTSRTDERASAATYATQGNLFPRWRTEIILDPARDLFDVEIDDRRRTSGSRFSRFRRRAVEESLAFVG